MDIIKSKQKNKGRPKKLMDSEKRLKRDILNKHELARMQKIKNGFQLLQNLLENNFGKTNKSRAEILFSCSQYIEYLDKLIMLFELQNLQLTQYILLNFFNAYSNC